MPSLYCQLVPGLWPPIHGYVEHAPLVRVAAQTLCRNLAEAEVHLKVQVHVQAQGHVLAQAQALVEPYLALIACAVANLQQ